MVGSTAAVAPGSYFTNTHELVKALLQYWPHPPHVQCPSLVLCGPAGNGKSYLVDSICDDMQHAERATSVASSKVVRVSPELAPALTVRTREGSTGLRSTLKRAIAKTCRDVRTRQRNGTTGEHRGATGPQSDLTGIPLTLLLELDHIEYFTAATDGGMVEEDKSKSEDTAMSRPTHPMFMADLFGVLRGRPPLLTESECHEWGVERLVVVSLFSGEVHEMHLFPRDAVFDYILFLPTPNECERLTFFSRYFEGMLSQDATALSEALAYRSGGISYRGLTEIAANAYKLLRERADEKESWPFAVVAHQAAKLFHHSCSMAALEYRRSGGYVDVQTTKWSDVAGMASVKELLQQLIMRPLRYKELYQRAGLRPSTGVLMYGPPGTGKTMLAKAMATELNASFMYLDLPELVQCEVGESERKLKQFFTVARERSPTVMFMDELQAAFGVRYADANGPSARSSSAHDARLVSHLLCLLDDAQADVEHPVIFVGATNAVRLLDPLLLRAGRLDTLIEVPLPDAEAREALVRKVVHEDWAPWLSAGVVDGEPHQVKVAVLQKLLVEGFVRATDHLSGATIRSMTSVFAVKLLQDVLTKHATLSSSNMPILAPSIFVEELLDANGTELSRSATDLMKAAVHRRDGD